MPFSPASRNFQARFASRMRPFLGSTKRPWSKRPSELDIIRNLVSYKGSSLVPLQHIRGRLLKSEVFRHPVWHLEPVETVLDTCHAELCTSGTCPASRSLTFRRRASVIKRTFHKVKGPISSLMFSISLRCSLKKIGGQSVSRGVHP